MAVALTPAQRAALQGHAIAFRGLIDLYLDSGRYSFWDGDQHMPFDGATYLAAGAFLSASSISLGTDLGAEGIELILDGTRLANAATEAGVPTDPAAILAAMEGESYQQRRVEVRYALFSAETGNLILTLRRFNGLIDQVEQREEINDDGVSTQMLVVKCESVARRYGRRGGRTRSHEDQNEIFAGDNFFKFTLATIAGERRLYWGRIPPDKQGMGGLPGLMGGVVRNIVNSA